MPLQALSDPNQQPQQGVVGAPISRATGAGANAPQSAPPTSPGYAPSTGYSSVGGAARQQLGQQSNPTGAPWQNTQRDQGGQATPWQPSPQQQQPSYQPPAQQPQQGQGPSQQSIAQQGLSGGAATTQNFLAALRQVGAGSNNAAMASPAPVQAQAQPLLGAPVAMGGGPGSVSYNNGLGAGGGNVSFGGQAPGVSLGGNFASPNRLMVPQQGGAGGSGAAGGAGAGAQGTPGFSPTPVPRTGQTVLNGPAAGQQPNPFAPGQTPPDPDLTRDGGYMGLPQNRPLSAPPPSAPLATPLSAPTPQQQQLNNGMAQTNNYQYDLTALSDERGKRDVGPAKKKIGAFLDALGAHEYAYKDPAHGKGRFVSPMAQELERTTIGKSAIVEGADGLKRVDYARLAGAQLAAAALFHRRLKALEGRRR